ncbi:DUF456 domain-containing protein [Peptococcaceae bacterium 1198_IL3148]
MSWIGITLAVLLMLVGLAGTILPLLPGGPLIVLGMVVYGAFEGFAAFSPTFWIGQVLLLMLIFAVDYLAGAIGAQKYGGSKAAVWGSIVGGVVGLFLLGPFGILLGPFFGAIIGELLSNRPLEQAIKVGVGTLLGFAGGALVKLIIEIGMIVWFLLVVF